MDSLINNNTHDLHWSLEFEESRRLLLGQCYDQFSSPVGDRTENISEVRGILTTAHQEFGGCAHCCTGKLKRREQD